MKDIIDHLDNRASYRSFFMLCQYLNVLLSSVCLHRCVSFILSDTDPFFCVCLLQSTSNMAPFCDELMKALQAKSVWPGAAKASEEQLLAMLKKEVISPGTLHRALLQERVALCGDKTAVARLLADKSNAGSDRLLGMLAIWKPREYSAHLMTASALSGEFLFVHICFV